MANIIKPKRSNTAAKVPNTTELTSGELGVNMADRKVYINNGTSVVQVGAGNLSGLGDASITSPTNGQALTYNSTTGKWENTAAAGTGTVTSVGITAGTGVTVSNSPITTSGNIAVGLSTKLTAIENLSGAGFFTQNGSGAIAGRTLQAGTGISIAHGNGSSQDPVITNSAPDQTVALTGGGATSISGTYPNFTISSVNTTYGAATSTVPGLIELGSDTAQTVAANAVSATASRSYALQVNAAGQGVVNVPWTDTNSGGTVTSVSGTGTASGLSLSGTVTTSGNLTLSGTVNSLAAGTYAISISGNAATATNVAYSGLTGTVPTWNQNTTGTAANVTGTVAIANGGTGATTRQNAMDALAGAVTSGQYLRGNGTDVVMSAIQAADVPTLNQNTTGTAAVSTAATVTTSSTASAFKVPFANTTANTTGNYGLLQDSEGTFTYNPSTNTLTVGTVSGALSGNATTATTATNVSGGTANVTTLTVNSNNISAVNSLGFRNRIINGDMRIDQRNAGAAVTAPSGVIYALDRWAFLSSQASKYTVQQNAGGITPPNGFLKYQGITSLSAYTVTSTDYNFLIQIIEGFNGSDLVWGTAAAQTVTLSFWARSSLTGTFSGSVRNGPSNRSYVFSYTISSANTWEFKTVTIAGNTSGSWPSDNSGWGSVTFCLGSGSTRLGAAGSWQTADLDGVTGTTSVVGTSGATFYITGVQLEAGSVATPFERRDYGRELMMCQRYYAEVSATPTSASIYSYVFLPVTMRALPTVALKAGGLAGASYGSAPYGTNSIRQNTSASGAIDALLSANSEL
jgi:hypothetical protein